MSETAQSQASTQLLDRLVRLEQANAALEQKVSKLEVEFLAEVKNTSDHLVYLYRRMRDFLWPVVHKVFPGYSRAMEQSAAILNLKPEDER